MPQNQQEPTFHNGRLARQQAVRLSSRLPGDPVQTSCAQGEISRSQSGNPRPIRRLRRRCSKLRHTHAKDSPGQAITLLPLVLNLKGLIKENGAPSFVLVERGGLAILSVRLAP